MCQITIDLFLIDLDSVLCDGWLDYFFFLFYVNKVLHVNVCLWQTNLYFKILTVM